MRPNAKGTREHQRKLRNQLPMLRENDTTHQVLGRQQCSAKQGNTKHDNPHAHWTEY